MPHFTLTFANNIIRSISLSSPDSPVSVYSPQFQLSRDSTGLSRSLFTSDSETASTVSSNEQIPLPVPIETRTAELPDIVELSGPAEQSAPQPGQSAIAQPLELPPPGVLPTDLPADQNPRTHLSTPQPADNTPQTITSGTLGNPSKTGYLQHELPAYQTSMARTPTKNKMVKGNNAGNATDDSAAKKQRIQDAQALAQQVKYNPFTMLPNKWKENVDLTTITIRKAPPAIPKFDEPAIPMQIVGFITDHPHSYSEPRDCFVRLAHSPAYIKFKAISPWYEICDSSGQTMPITECHLLPNWREDLDRLKAAKEQFIQMLHLLGKANDEYNSKMVSYRAEYINDIHASIVVIPMQENESMGNYPILQAIASLEEEPSLEDYESALEIDDPEDDLFVIEPEDDLFVIEPEDDPDPSNTTIEHSIDGHTVGKEYSR
ncbi:uncharacterized protein CDV56_108196 [Aspergillus thermomutatus]|uniref:Uncharacterized protein n=1 Tax=Aspergillus thermomutatus TaxID=41047 RepID=A0A397HD08_ASPTH|nr:uncharacterized protein CDV56_108196 [Aspergillus thermomutatus]RHZ59456.1 hypothetical protein CDV56_108196 [Aspergillus thermomutatus]